MHAKRFAVLLATKWLLSGLAAVIVAACIARGFFDYVGKKSPSDCVEVNRQRYGPQLSADVNELRRLMVSYAGSSGTCFQPPGLPELLGYYGNFQSDKLAELNILSAKISKGLKERGLSECDHRSLCWPSQAICTYHCPL